MYRKKRGAHTKKVGWWKHKWSKTCDPLHPRRRFTSSTARANFCSASRSFSWTECNSSSNRSSRARPSLDGDPCGSSQVRSKTQSASPQRKSSRGGELHSTDECRKLESYCSNSRFHAAAQRCEFASTPNCCAGAQSGHHAFVGSVNGSADCGIQRCQTHKNQRETTCVWDFIHAEIVISFVLGVRGVDSIQKELKKQRHEDLTNAANQKRTRLQTR